MPFLPFSKHKLTRVISIFALVNTFITMPILSQDREAFFDKHLLKIDPLTTKWETGVFTGNGILGNMVYMLDAQTLRVEVSRTDVTEHQTSEDILPIYGDARLPVGYFTLKPQGVIHSNTAEIDIYNAEARGVIRTDKGSIRWRTMTLAQGDPNVMIVETEATGAETNYTWQFVPENALPTRVHYRGEADLPASYQKHPPAQLFDNVCIQPYATGGDHSTAWKCVSNGAKRTYYITITTDQHRSTHDEATKIVDKAMRTDLKTLVETHRKWWHNYYSRSEVHLPDPKIEQFYWVQQYKMASATRSGGRPIDLLGPWFRETPWACYWLNLNIQLTYSSMYTGNRLDLAETLVQMIDNAAPTLSRNVPEAYRHNAIAVGRSAGLDLQRGVKVQTPRDTTATDSDLEMGNLTWMLYYYYLHYRYTLDPVLKAKLVVLLTKSVNYYLDVLVREDDQRLHLPPTYSPEYPSGITRDANYDLALLRWGLHTLLQLDPHSAQAEQWRRTLSELVEYPQDTNGLRIGRDVPFDESHRHYSHLLMIYPLAIVNWEQPESRDLITTSLNRWHSFRNALQGYSFTGGASIYAQMHEGDKALAYLKTLLNRYVKPNTMYLETGPVIETPLAAVASIHELLLQSWGDKVRVFPALPSSWKDVSFKHLLAEGGFDISAVRTDGITREIVIESRSNGGTCVLQHDIRSPKVEGTKEFTVLPTGEIVVYVPANKKIRIK